MTLITLTLENKQFALDTCALSINNAIDQLQAGLITITEFKQLIVHACPNNFSVDYMAGLTCPYTRLRYPTQEELDFVDTHCGHLA